MKKFIKYIKWLFTPTENPTIEWEKRCKEIEERRKKHIQDIWIQYWRKDDC